MTEDPNAQQQETGEDTSGEPEAEMGPLMAHRFFGTDHESGCLSCGLPFDHPVHQTL